MSDMKVNFTVIDGEETYIHELWTFREKALTKQRFKMIVNNLQTFTNGKSNLMAYADIKRNDSLIARVLWCEFERDGHHTALFIARPNDKMHEIRCN